MIVTRHRRAFGEATPALEDPGFVRFRGSGETHAYAPKVVKALQAAVTTDGQLAAYRELLDEQGPRQPRDLVTLRQAGSRVAAGGGGARQPDRAAIRELGDEPRGPLAGGAPGDQHRHGTARRQRELRRGRRGSGVVRAVRRRRSQGRRGQAGGLGTLRRHCRVPGPRGAARDQDRAGLEAGRGRAAAWKEGHRLHRRAAPRPAGHDDDQPAAAPRHLLDRGPRPAHQRPARRQPHRPHRREAGGGGGDRDDRRGRGQGARRLHHGQRALRRHGRLAAELDQACGAAVGARAGRDAPGARSQPAAGPCRAAHRRRPPDRSRRRRRRHAGRRGVRVRNGRAGGHRLRHGAPVPPRHLPDRHRDATRGAARQVHRHPGAGGRLLHGAGRGRSARACRARPPLHRRGDRPRGPPCGDRYGSRPGTDARARRPGHPPPTSLRRTGHAGRTGRSTPASRPMRSTTSPGA